MKRWAIRQLGMLAAVSALALVFGAAVSPAQERGGGQRGGGRGATTPAGLSPGLAQAARRVEGLFGADLAPVDPFKVVGNIYSIGAADIGIYLITTPEGHIVIDSGASTVASQALGNINKLGFKVEDVKIILISHAHVDHIQALAYLQRQTGARVMVIEAEAPAVESGKDLSTLGVEGWEPVKVDRVLHDNEEVKLGGVTMRAIWTPGHTPGATAWVTKTTDGGRDYTVLWGGPPGPVVGNPKFNTREQDAMTSFSRLRTVTPDIILPAHPRRAFTDKYAALRAGTRPHPLLEMPGAWAKSIDDAEANYQRRLTAAPATN